LLINTTVDEKNLLQDWLSKNDKEMILYLYDNSKDITWLINVLKQVNTSYINVDNSNDISYYYISYLVGHTNITWNSEGIDLSVINKDQVRNINEYIQRNWVE
jgi:hypothetical protein